MPRPWLRPQSPSSSPAGSPIFAPVFVFLAGASAYLSRALGKQRTAGELAGFLASRGLFLMLLELTVIRLGMQFNWSLDRMFLQVIWVIGLSMVCLALLVACRLPPVAIGVLGGLIVFGHNLLDLVGAPSGLGGPAPPPSMNPLFALCLRPGALPLPFGATWFVAYPLLPWFGIMALGYAFGRVLVMERWSRVRLTAAIGVAATLAFVLLRAWGIYGDPKPFQAQDTMTKTVLAFLNCQKYPPSLLYALMTLGPGLLVLAGLDATEGEIALHRRNASPLRQGLVTLGRVPLFYYILQWPVIHLLTIVVGELNGHRIPWTSSPFSSSSNSGYSLGFVYFMWLVVMVLLYIPCRWYAGLKLRHKEWTWLSYL